MDQMQHARRRRDVVRAEIDREVHRRRLPATGTRHCRRVVRGVDTHVTCRGDRDGREGVHFVVGPAGGFLVGGEALDDVRAGVVVGAAGAGDVVGAVEGGRCRRGCRT